MLLERTCGAGVIVVGTIWPPGNTFIGVVVGKVLPGIIAFNLGSINRSREFDTADNL